VTGRFKAIAVLMAAALLALSALGCSAGGSSPEKTVEKALAAMEDMNVEHMASFFTEETRPQVISGMNYALERIEEIRVSSLQTRVISEVGTTASVEAEYDLETVSSVQTRSVHVVKTLTLVDVAGEWLLSDVSLIE
jgi:hypothetical protein